MVVSETNYAIDNIALKLREKNMKLLRIGNLKSINPNLKTFETCLQIKRLTWEKEGLNRSQIMKRISQELDETKIICATNISVGLKDLSKLKCPLVIIDEVSQCLIPHIMIPLSLYCEKLVLFGDNMQLPPVVFSLYPFNWG